MHSEEEEGVKKEGIQARWRETGARGVDKLKDVTGGREGASDAAERRKTWAVSLSD